MNAPDIRALMNILDYKTFIEEVEYIKHGLVLDTDYIAPQLSDDGQCYWRLSVN